MSTSANHYVVDSDVFIDAKNRYYGFDICPGFWKSLLHHHVEQRVVSIDRVKSELLAGAEGSRRPCPPWRPCELSGAPS